MNQEQNPLRTLAARGQSVWYDNIDRHMLTSGKLERLIREDGLAGITSNPAIFEKAITAGSDYDDAIRKLSTGAHGNDARALFYELALADIRAAADQLRAVFDASAGVDGMVSLEVSPDLAYDTEATVREALELHRRIERPNVMIKVPATAEGVPACEELIAAGVNVNVTLLFSVNRYLAVARAYLRGLERRRERGLPVAGVASVASFFVSRLDAAVDPELHRLGRPELAGKSAIANAKVAYQRFGELFGAGFARLRELGAGPQRLLWASTSTKNPDYRDVLYVESLVGAETVNTIPPATWEAFRDHGRVEETLSAGADEAEQQLRALTELGIDLDAVTRRLGSEGVAAFARAFDNLLAALESKSEVLVA
jgi:transaldolase